MMTIFIKPPLASLPGGLERIERFCSQIAARIPNEPNIIQLALTGPMTCIHLWRGRIAEAIRTGESMLAMKQQYGDFLLVGLVAATFAGVAHAARGEYAAADRFFETVLPQIEAESPAPTKAIRSNVLFQLGRTRLLQGRLEEARQIYARMSAATPASTGGIPEFPDAPVLREIMRGLLELAERRYADAERTLRRAVSLEQSVPSVTLIGNARLMLASLYLERNRRDEALAELAPVLAECERHGTPGLIFKEGAIVIPLLRLAVERRIHPQFAAHILDLLGVPVGAGPVRVPDTGETLSPREVEVLRLLSAGASNRSIAQHLVITERTAKAHVSNILRKLNAASRTAAVARARELRLV